MELTNIGIALFWILAAFWISKAIIPVLILVAERRNLYDYADCDRKIHTDKVPTFGGIAIFTALIVAFSASSFAEQMNGYGYFVAASVILFTAGIKDDLLSISPAKKLIAQFISAGLVIFGSGIYFQSFGGLFGIYAVSPWFGIPITFFTFITVINAFNLVDGIDSLAGGVAAISAAFFGYWFFVTGQAALAVFSGILIASLLGFLWYNRPPAKIFMGDTGSMLVGFYLSFLAIAFVNSAIAMPTMFLWQSAAPVIAIAALIIPLYDTMRVFVLRISRGRSPFAPDRTHVHHHLLDAGFSHGQASVFLFLVNIFVLSFAILFSQYMGNTVLLSAVAFTSLLFFPTNRWKRKLSRAFTLQKTKPEPSAEWVIHDQRPDEKVLAELQRKRELMEKQKSEKFEPA
jgi:UDP-GlcNAc:undecaprenyl-phosphate/decaprenyl-phosphate GlcNAc-1-phosphate transferase